MPNTDAATEAFKNALNMYIFIFGSWSDYNLNSTSDLLPALRNCVVANLNARGTPAPIPNSPQPESAPQPNPEVEGARDKIIKEAMAKYDDCVQSQMKEIVPYSDEGAETISQAIITKCTPDEERVIELSMAVYGATRAHISSIINPVIEARKKTIVAEIVTFRAELKKALLSQQKNEETIQKKAGQGL
jgi:hypothetical protein